MQAAELDYILSKIPGSVAGLAPVFFKRAAQAIDTPWQLAVGEDFRFPETTGPKLGGVDVINRYVAAVHRATLEDAVVGAAFIKVMNLPAPPRSLTTPGIMLRVWQANRRLAQQAGRIPPRSRTTAPQTAKEIASVQC